MVGGKKNRRSQASSSSVASGTEAAEPAAVSPGPSPILLTASSAFLSADATGKGTPVASSSTSFMSLKALGSKLLPGSLGGGDSQGATVGDDSQAGGGGEGHHNHEHGGIGLLVVDVFEARGLLPASKLGRTIDPFCSLMLEDQQGQTRVVEGQVSPTWQERFVFHVHHPYSALKLSIWDSRPVLKNWIILDQFLGQVSIPLAGLENKVTDRWYRLTPGSRPSATISGTVHIRVHYKPSKQASVPMAIHLLDGTYRHFALSKDTTTLQTCDRVVAALGLPESSRGLWTLFLVGPGIERPLRWGQSPLRVMADAMETDGEVPMSWFEYLTGYQVVSLLAEVFQPSNQAGERPAPRRGGFLGSSGGGFAQSTKNQVPLRLFFQQRFFLPSTPPSLQDNSPVLLHLLFLQTCRVVREAQAMRITERLATELAALQLCGFGFLQKGERVETLVTGGSLRSPKQSHSRKKSTPTPTNLKGGASSGDSKAHHETHHLLADDEEEDEHLYHDDDHTQQQPQHPQHASAKVVDHSKVLNAVVSFDEVRNAVIPAVLLFARRRAWWNMAIVAALEALPPGITPDQAKAQYVQRVYSAWPWLSTHLFSLTRQLAGPVFLPTLLSINGEGLHFVKRNLTKCVASFRLSFIASWVVTTSKFSFLTRDGQRFTFAVREGGAAISSALNQHMAMLRVRLPPDSLPHNQSPRDAEATGAGGASAASRPMVDLGSNSSKSGEESSVAAADAGALLEKLERENAELRSQVEQLLAGKKKP